MIQPIRVAPIEVGLFAFGLQPGPFARSAQLLLHSLGDLGGHGFAGSLFVVWLLRWRPVLWIFSSLALPAAPWRTVRQVAHRSRIKISQHAGLLARRLRR